MKNLFFVLVFSLFASNIFAQTPIDINVTGNWYRVAESSDVNVGGLIHLIEGMDTLTINVQMFNTSSTYERRAVYADGVAEFPGHPFEKIRFNQNTIASPVYVEVYIESSGTYDVAIEGNESENMLSEVNFTTGEIPSGWDSGVIDVESFDFNGKVVSPFFAVSNTVSGDADGDPTNELQEIAYGDGMLSISNSNSIEFDYVRDTFQISKIKIGNQDWNINMIPKERGTVDLLLEIGQSNAFGGGGTDTSNIDGSYLVENPNLKIHNSVSGSWENIHIGVNNFSAQKNVPNRVNMDFAMIDASQKVFEGEIYRMVYAEGGQKLSRFRRGGIGHTEFFSDYLVDGVNDLIDQGNKVKVWPLILMQGEANAQDTVDIRTYRSELINFISTYRKDIHEDLGFVFCEILSSSYPYADSINAIFRQVAKDYQNIFVVSSQGLTSTGDDIHLDEISQYERCRRVMDIYHNNPHSAVYIQKKLYDFNSYAMLGKTDFYDFNYFRDSLPSPWFTDINGTHSIIDNVDGNGVTRRLIGWLGSINPDNYPFPASLMKLNGLNDVYDCDISFYINALNAGSNAGVILRASEGESSIMGYDVNIQDNKCILRARSGAANFLTIANVSIPSIIGGAHVRIQLRGHQIIVDLSYDNELTWTNYINSTITNSGYKIESGEIWFRSGTASSSPTTMWFDDLQVSY